jgi:hypothetical protein
MAKGAGGKKIRVASPMLTKNGKQRLGPLSLTQLKDMLEKTSLKKNKSKILNRIRVLEARVK